MCSKPIFAKAERSTRISSSPRQIKKCVKRETSAGGSEQLVTAQSVYHTVLLFKDPSLPAQVCCAPKEGVPAPLQSPQGLHLEHLRQAFSCREVCHYEWHWEMSPASTVCRTTLLPLTGPTGQVTEVMAITQDISQWEDTNLPKHTLREGSSPKTFAQILLFAREDEKREIAKALHDEIGTASVMLSALVSMAKQSVRNGNTEQVLADLDRLQTQTEQSMERLRTIIVTLRPPSLDTDGALRGSLETLIEDVCKLGRISYRFNCSTQMSEKGIGDRVKILLYRVVQEALSNVIKHAQANQVTVELKREKGQLFLTVQDNGKGFVRSKVSPIQHVGLLAMKNAVGALGGRLTIVSKLGKGTRICVVCPCVAYEENS